MTPEQVEEMADRFRLTGNERRVFQYLARFKIATAAELIDVLYGDRADGGPLYALQTTRVTLSNLRKKLASYATITQEKYYVFQPLPRAIDEDPPP